MMQKAGYRFDVARIWSDVPGGLVVEHTMKRHKDRLGLPAWKSLCPLCMGESSETLDFDAVLRLRGAGREDKPAHGCGL